MPPDATITLTLADGEWSATDEETDLTGRGDTRRAALDHLDELRADAAVDVDFAEEFDAEFDDPADEAEDESGDAAGDA